jgi:hypothetical protein
MEGTSAESQEDAELLADVLSSLGKLTNSDEKPKMPAKATVTIRKRKETRIGKVDGLA